MTYKYNMYISNVKVMFKLRKSFTKRKAFVSPRGPTQASGHVSVS